MRSSGRREGGTCLRFDPLDHRPKAIRALWGQVLAQRQTLEDLNGVGAKDLARRPARIQREQDRNEAPDNVSVAIADEFEDRSRLALGLDLGRKPDLAGAALHLVGVDSCRLRQRLERTSELDDISITVVPIVE